ncbi:serpin family protein [Candidatus Bipolaricaulota bacterium]|nr:serpin family protein [Candidatus Bipolaricaulota bacterium]
MSTNARRRWAAAGMLLLGALLAGFGGCELINPDLPQDEAVARSDLLRDMAPHVPENVLQVLATDNAQFALALLAAVRGDEEGRERDENLFFSPHSISTALAMAYAGARGTTQLQMKDALRWSLGQDLLHSAFNALDLVLESRAQPESPYEGNAFQLHIVNAVWGQVGYPFQSPFLDVLAVHYGAGIRLLDFISEPEIARGKINDWVWRQTQERINDLLPQGAVNTDTRLVLTNAVYFNAPWLRPFDETLTEPESFTTRSGTETTVPMMHQTALFGYAEWDGGRAVELLYNGATLSMVILLPDPGKFDAFEPSLVQEIYAGIVSRMETRQVHLSLPRFAYSTHLSLVPPLVALGMNAAFSPGEADFSGIDGSRSLFISDVIHEAFVSVNEAGTEAAAATAVLFERTSVPGPPVTVTVNRPFLFVIQDLPTGEILFVGRVVDPSPLIAVPD